jgi:L-asparagine permease
MGSAIEYDTSALAHEDEGYHRGLKPRQLQVIAIGGVIGTGPSSGSFVSHAREVLGEQAAYVAGWM